MIILLFFVFLGFTILAILADGEDLACIPLVGAFVCLIVAIVLCAGVKDGAVIDEKIAMYKKENTKIEAQMDMLVSQYMKFETDTYGELKNESSITLVSLYPDLKSDELVKKQIDVYESNNKEIRKMKERKIDLKVLKWWLYFGK
jgi:hypothetical protein|nr:MAG TPA: hypothetical protein [Caudoviricetes sp.]